MALGLSPTEIVKKGAYPLLNIHSNWNRIFLSEVADVLNGFAFDSANFNNRSVGKPLIRIRDVGKGNLETYYDGPWTKQYIVQNGDLLIGMDGDFKCAKWHGEEALLNQRVCKIVLSTNRYSSEFLFYVLQPYLDAINAETSSVTVKHLSSKTIQRIPLPNPPLPIQKAIVAKIEELFSELEAGVQELQIALRRLRIYRQAVLNHYLSNSDWKHGKLEEVSKKIQVGPFGTQLHQEDYITDGIPLVNPTHIKKGKIVVNMDLTVTEEKYAELSNYYLQAGDTIMGRRGEMARCALVTEKESGWLCGTGSLYIRPDRGKANPKFLYLILGSSATKTYLENQASGSTMSNLNLKILKNVPISIPDLDTQNQTVLEIEACLSEADMMETTINQELARTESLRQSILKHAFEGKLVAEPTNVISAEEPIIEYKASGKALSGQSEQLSLF